MLVESVRGFRDLTEGTFREAGARFEVSEERFGELNGSRYGTLVVAVEEPKPEPKPKQTTRRRTTRRKTAE